MFFFSHFLLMYWSACLTCDCMSLSALCIYRMCVPGDISCAPSSAQRLSVVLMENSTTTTKKNFNKAEQSEKERVGALCCSNYTSLHSSLWPIRGGKKGIDRLAIMMYFLTFLYSGEAKLHHQRWPRLLRSISRRSSQFLYPHRSLYSGCLLTAETFFF